MSNKKMRKKLHLKNFSTTGGFGFWRCVSRRTANVDDAPNILLPTRKSAQTISLLASRTNRSEKESLEVPAADLQWTWTRSIP